MPDTLNSDLRVRKVADMQESARVSSWLQVYEHKPII